MQQSLKVGFAAAALALAASAAPAVGQGALRIDINIPTHRLVVYEGEAVLREYPISVGKSGYDTPDGEFTIDRAEWNPWWRPPTNREWARDARVTPPGPNNPMGRVKLFFAPLYYIHGTADVENLGQPASHGCVRMRNADVIELGKLLHERAGGSARGAEIDAILARPSATRHTRLNAPVPLTIRYQPIVVEGGELRVYPDVYGRGRIHTEGVYQALLRAGYDPSGIDRAAIRQVLTRAHAADGPFAVPVADAFGAVPAAGR